MKSPLTIFLLILFSARLSSTTHHIGSGHPFSSLTQAANVSAPGDSIVFHQGIYPGGEFISNLQGNSSNYIHILASPGDTVIINGGGTAWQISDGAYLHFKGFIFEQQTSNGINIDDGGSYATPAHHLLFDSCTFRNINATGNNDLLKLSGVDSFEVRKCFFLNGSPGGGDAIDMVGCHDGLIKNCRFENMGAGSIQAKGGSRNIRIEANFFKNGGQRSLNLGGSTGMQFFRPDTAHYEAADLKVYSNVFIGSEAPIAFVGCTNTEVINNTFFLPTRWVVRILQENLDSNLLLCSNNIFRNNIIYRDNQLSTDCNVGPNTLPSTFVFSNNLWFHSQNSNWAGPSLPVTDSNSVIGVDPLFVDAAQENFMIQLNSPAIGIGYSVSAPVFDFSGNAFDTIRSAGALEKNSSTKITDENLSDRIAVFPNPFTQFTTFDFSHSQLSSASLITFHLYTSSGNEVISDFTINNNNLMLNRKNLSAGIYLYRLLIDERIFWGRLVVR